VVTHDVIVGLVSPSRYDRLVVPGAARGAGQQIPLRPCRALAAVVAVPRVEPRLGGAGHRVRVPVEVQPLSAGIKEASSAPWRWRCRRFLRSSQRFIRSTCRRGGDARMALLPLDALGLQRDGARLGVIARAVPCWSVSHAAILPMLPRKHMLWGPDRPALDGSLAPWRGQPALSARLDVVRLADRLRTGLWIVVARMQPVATMQSWPLQMRAGIRRAIRTEEPR
jgi:hypothetical protein